MATNEALIDKLTAAGWSKRYATARANGASHEDALQYAYPGYYNKKKQEDAAKKAEKNATIAGIASPVMQTGLTLGSLWGMNKILNGGKEAADTTAKLLQTTPTTATTAATPLTGASTFSASAPEAAADSYIASQGLGSGAGATGAAEAAPASGMLGYALPAAAGALWGNNLWEEGLNKIIGGKAKGADFLNAGLATHGFMPLQAAFRLFGLPSIGESIFGKSTKQYQKERADALAGNDPTFAHYLQSSGDNAEAIKTVLDKANAATGDKYQGWYDDPTTTQNEWAWVNKNPLNVGDVKTPEQMAALGSGDVINMPWFYENFNNWGSLPMEQRNQIAQAAIASGTALGNKGNVDFSMTPDLVNAAQALGLQPRNYLTNAVLA